MLGHADLATTSRYLHLDDDDLADAIDSIHNDTDADLDLDEDLAAERH
jgi:site-specific recombinase XerC